MQRIDKILSEAGIATRKELRDMIRCGRVMVNGTVVKKPEDKFDENAAQVLLDGVPVRTKSTVLLMMHKPAGYVTSTEDPRDPTVMELVPEEYLRLGVKPIGRLDKETEGLLLFTNDGDLAHRILSPKTEVWKTYLAHHEGQARPEDVEAFRKGLQLRDGTVCLSAELEPIDAGKSIIRVREGKYHQVRRMMAACGMHVDYLIRIAEGNLSLGNLPKGAVIEVSSTEI